LHTPSCQKIIIMKKRGLIILILICFLSITKTFAQNEEHTKQPDINIKVNIKKDKNGNIVSYDSTVVITWQSKNSTLNSDSLFEAMMKKMHQSFSFYEDSTFYNFLFAKPYSLFDIEKEFERMDEMFLKEMQSLFMNDFFDYLKKEKFPENKSQDNININENTKIKSL